MVLMLLAAFGALSAFLGSIGTARPQALTPW